MNNAVNAAKKPSVAKGRRYLGSEIVFNLIIFLCVLLCIIPVIHVVALSVSGRNAVMSNRVFLLPKDLDMKAYQSVFLDASMIRSLGFSIALTVGYTAFAMFCSILLAYPLSKPDLPGQKWMMVFILIPMYFSGGMIPMYLTVQQLHIYNTTWAMVLPVAVSAYNLIVCRSFFESGIPVELLEAAKIDGCSDFGFFFKIAIPLSKTIIAVMCLFYATAMWNQFFNALMFLQDDSKMPLQVVLRNLVLMNQSNQMGSSASEMVTKQKLAEQLKYCVVVVSAFPLLCVYPFLQKYFAKGVTIGAVKG